MRGLSGLNLYNISLKHIANLYINLNKKVRWNFNTPPLLLLCSLAPLPPISFPCEYSTTSQVLVRDRYCMYSGRSNESTQHRKFTTSKHLTIIAFVWSRTLKEKRPRILMSLNDIELVSDYEKHIGNGQTDGHTSFAGEVKMTP